jgi:hypothetical protein
MRKSIEFILNYVVEQVSELNGFKSTPNVNFKPLHLADYAVYMSSLYQLYSSGNLSRQSYAEELGFNWAEEIDKRIAEEKLLVDSGLPEFAPTPNSRVPLNSTTPNSSVSPMDQQKGQNPANNQQATASENSLGTSIDKLIIAMAENQSKQSNIKLDLSPVTFSLPENKPPIVNITLPEQQAAQITVENNIPEQKEYPIPNITFSPTMDTPIVNVTVPPSQVTVENNVPVPQVTVNNNVETPEVTVNNNVPVPEVTVENNVVTPDVTVNNNVPVPEVSIDNTIKDSNPT